MNKKRDNGDGTIRKRTDGRWEGRLTVGVKKDGSPAVKYFYGSTQKEVKQKIKEAKVTYPKSQEKNPMQSLDEYMNWYLKEVKYGTVKDSTWTSVSTCYRCHVKDVLGDMPLCEVKPRDIQQLINDMRKSHFSVGTIRSVKNILSPMFDYALSENLITMNPAERVQMPSEKSLGVKQKKKTSILTKEEQDAINAFADNWFNSYGTRYKDVFVYQFILNTGLREGEMVALLWEDVDWENKFITVNKTFSRSRSVETGQYVYSFTAPKTSTSCRKVKLNTKACEALNNIKKYQKMKGIETKYVLCNEAGGYVLPYYIYKEFNAFMKHIMGEQYVVRGLHALRHTFATNCVKNKININMVAKLLGHSKTSMTYNVYVHSCPEMEDETYNLLEKI